MAINPARRQHANAPTAIPAMTPAPRPSSSPLAFTVIPFSLKSDGAIVASVRGSVGAGVIIIMPVLGVGANVGPPFIGVIVGTGAGVGTVVVAPAEGVGATVSTSGRTGGSGQISTEGNVIGKINIVAKR